jgi:hypothetical protein
VGSADAQADALRAPRQALVELQAQSIVVTTRRERRDRERTSKAHAELEPRPGLAERRDGDVERRSRLPRIPV